MTAREVELTGGAPWGFRMHGGADHNQPIRISRVNPGRKASVCGIREGDVISSINGRPTRAMSNADAHSMLRSAGPVLRLGLNEDREALPRRRSIGKANELKRPSQLLAEVQSGRATPQAPVYATIRPSQSPHNRTPSSMRNSLTSLPAALNSTPLVKSVASEESPRFHPTNPFYTTLPSNYSSASKLPVPNRTPLSTLDKNKSETFNDYCSDLKSPSFFTKKPELNCGPSSLPYSSFNTGNTNGYETGNSRDKNDHFNANKFEQFHNQSLPNDDKIKNPFDTKRNSDPFEKYLRPENRMNGDFENIKSIPISMSDSNFRKEETVKSSTITEHKISEIEEVKTIKKIILNGRDESSSSDNIFKPNKSSEFSQESKEFCSTKLSPKKENTNTTQQNAQFSTIFDQKENERKNFSTSSVSRQSLQEKYNALSAEAPENEVVTVKPPVGTPTAAPSPTKRKYPLPLTIYF